MKSDKAHFAVAGAALTAAMLVAFNIIVSPHTLWFIYPVYALAWWPLGVIFCTQKRYLTFAAAGSLVTLLFLAAVNLLTSPAHLWFLYAVAPLLCVPAAVHLRGRIKSVAVAAVLAAVLALYAVVINLLLTPGCYWAVYPVFAVLWWPLSLVFKGKHGGTMYAVCGALAIMAFLILDNMLNTAYPWALYACPAVVFWPLSVFLGKRMGTLSVALAVSACVVAWYGALNLMLEPGSPWVMFVAYAALWWPLSVGFYGKRRAHVYAAVMSAVSIAFFAAVNAVYSPGALWAHYSAYAILWWPLSVAFYGKRRAHVYAAVMSAASTAFFAHRGSRKLYAVVMSALSIGFLVAVNLLTSPAFLWSAFPSLGLLWWPLAAALGKRAGIFSVTGSLLVIVTALTVNLMTSPGFLWSVFVMFAVLWWPLSVLFFAQRKKRLA